MPVSPDDVERFARITEKPIVEQAAFFIKSFVFELPTIAEVFELQEEFSSHVASSNEETDLNPVQAAAFLQKHGKTRTALQRKDELKDVDLDQNNRICFLEYLLLHYKVMILTAYHKRHSTTPPYDLSKDGIGLTGVGEELMEELFHTDALLTPAEQMALDEFTAAKKERQEKVDKLKAIIDSSTGVKLMTAKNELKQLEADDWETEKNRLDLKFSAAKRKKTGRTESMYAAKKMDLMEQKKIKHQESKNALKAKMSAYQQNVSARQKSHTKETVPPQIKIV